MEDTKQEILSLFKKRGCEISTNEILGEVYPELKNLQLKNDKDSKRKNAKAHRKLLYHINELSKSEIIRFSRFGEKGLKFFVLNIMEGEEISEITTKYKRKMTFSKPIMPSMPIENYEHQGIVIKYEPSSWIDKLNSVVVMAEKLNNTKEFFNVFENSIAVVNDCICFANFNLLLSKIKDSEAIEILEELNSSCKDYNKKASCIIEFQKLEVEKLKKFIERATQSDIKNVVLVYDLDNDELQEQFGLLNDIVSIYIRNKRTMYIKNKRLQKAPYFLGSAGAYCISENAWSSKNNDFLAVACGQSSLIVDVEKFYLLYGLDTLKFSELMLNISKSFLSANTIQRRKSKEYFKNIINLDKKNEKEFLEFSRNYIRLWNYGLSRPGIDAKLVLNMINEAKKRVKQFASAEETIYKSCGMPMRFKIALSCAFREANENLSPATYRRLEINNLDDLYKPKMKKEIVERENITSMFDGGNDVTFHKNGVFTSEDALREISVVMNTYKMPMFSYSFGTMKGDMKITSYL